MRQVKRAPEDPELFEQLLLTRAVAVLAANQKGCSCRHANVFNHC